MQSTDYGKNEGADTPKASGPLDPGSEAMLEHIENQRQLSERVPTVNEHVEITRKGNGCRISDFSSDMFKTAGPQADKLRETLVSASALAVVAARANGCFSYTQAQSVVDEFIVAANNELLTSESIEPLFGISEPDWTEVCGAFVKDNGSSDFDHACLGLLVYRAWKILLRVPSGRVVLLTEGEESVETIDAAHLNSFEAVRNTIAQVLVEDEMCTRFTAWVEMLPTSKVAENRALTPKEKQFLLAAIRDGCIDWRSSRNF